MKLKLSVYLVILLTTLSCASNRVVTHWHECIENIPVVNTFSSNGRNYEIVRLALPKKGEFGEKIKRKGKWSLTPWIREGKEECHHFSTINPYDKNNVKETRDSYVYGRRKVGGTNIIETVDLGYFPYSKNSFLKLNRDSNFEKLYMFKPVFKNGLVSAKGSLGSTSGKYRYIARKKKWEIDPSIVKLRNGRGGEIKEWNNVSTYIYSYSKLKYTNISKDPYSQNLFRLPGGVAFISKNKKSSKEKIKLYNDNMKEVKVAKGEDFLIRPILDQERIVHWYILRRTNKNNNLYSILENTGKFTVPPSSLGVRAMTVNVELSPKDPEHQSGKYSGLFHREKNPVVWFVAYLNAKKEITWGMASADFSYYSEPKWKTFKQYPDGWLFVQRAIDGRWELIDGYKTNLSLKTFKTADEGMNELQSVLSQRITIRKKEDRRRAKGYISWQNKVKRENEQKYNLAKANNDTEEMSKIAKWDRNIMAKYVSSGKASNAEIKNYLKGFKVDSLTANNARAILERRDLEKKQKEYEARLWKANKWNREKEAIRDRRRADLKDWRQTVRTNTRRTSRAVKKTWNKHQTDMYKKGYIEFPK